jgi:hypothetical protein
MALIVIWGVGSKVPKGLVIVLKNTNTIWLRREKHTDLKQP